MDWRTELERLEGELETLLQRLVLNPDDQDAITAREGLEAKIRGVVAERSEQFQAM